MLANEKKISGDSHVAAISKSNKENQENHNPEMPDKLEREDNNQANQEKFNLAVNNIEGDVKEGNFEKSREMKGVDEQDKENGEPGDAVENTKEQKGSNEPTSNRHLSDQSPDGSGKDAVDDNQKKGSDADTRNAVDAKHGAASPTNGNSGESATNHKDVEHVGERKEGTGEKRVGMDERRCSSGSTGSNFPDMNNEREENVCPTGEVKNSKTVKSSKAINSSGADTAHTTKLPKPTMPAQCPRCASEDTKFCYYNNYNVNQPRFYCRGCQRYWTQGGTLRDVPPGSGRRKTKPKSSQNTPLAMPNIINPMLLMNNPAAASNLNAWINSQQILSAQMNPLLQSQQLASPSGHPSAFEGGAAVDLSRIQQQSDAELGRPSDSGANNESNQGGNTGPTSGRSFRSVKFESSKGEGKGSSKSNHNGSSMGSIATHGAQTGEKRSHEPDNEGLPTGHHTKTEGGSIGARDLAESTKTWVEGLTSGLMLNGESSRNKISAPRPEVPLKDTMPQLSMQGVGMPPNPVAPGGMQSFPSMNMFSQMNPYNMPGFNMNNMLFPFNNALNPNAYNLLNQTVMMNAAAMAAGNYGMQGGDQQGSGASGPAPNDPYLAFSQMGMMNANPMSMAAGALDPNLLAQMQNSMQSQDMRNSSYSGSPGTQSFDHKEEPNRASDQERGGGCSALNPNCPTNAPSSVDLHGKKPGAACATNQEAINNLVFGNNWQATAAAMVMAAAANSPRQPNTSAITSPGGESTGTDQAPLLDNQRQHPFGQNSLFPPHQNQANTAAQRIAGMKNASGAHSGSDDSVIAQTDAGASRPQAMSGFSAWQRMPNGQSPR